MCWFIKMWLPVITANNLTRRCTHHLDQTHRLVAEVLADQLPQTPTPTAEKTTPTFGHPLSTRQTVPLCPPHLNFMMKWALPPPPSLRRTLISPWLSRTTPTSTTTTTHPFTASSPPELEITGHMKIRYTSHSHSTTGTALREKKCSMEMCPPFGRSPSVSSQQPGEITRSSRSCWMTGETLLKGFTPVFASLIKVVKC